MCGHLIIGQTSSSPMVTSTPPSACRLDKSYMFNHVLIAEDRDVFSRDHSSSWEALHDTHCAPLLPLKYYNLFVALVQGPVNLNAHQVIEFQPNYLSLIQRTGRLPQLPPQARDRDVSIASIRCFPALASLRNDIDLNLCPPTRQPSQDPRLAMRTYTECDNLKAYLVSPAFMSQDTPDSRSLAIPPVLIIV